MYYTCLFNKNIKMETLMNQNDYNKNYLDYFIKLENEIAKLKNYVHFSKKNFKTKPCYRMSTKDKFMI